VATKFQNFIASAQDRLIPNQTNPQLLKELVPALFGTVDLTAQATRIEWATATVTLTGSNKPQFDFPAVPADEIHVYRHIGVSNSAGAGNETWRLEVAYPGVTNRFQEGFTVNLTEPNLNILTIGPASSSNAQRMGRSLLLYPQGALRVGAGASGVATEVFTCNVLREVLGGPFSAQIVNDLITASEV